MAVFDWPDGLMPQTSSMTLRKLNSQFRSPFNGSTQTISYIGDRWILSVTMPPKTRQNAGLAEAFWLNISGGIDKVRAWHFATRGVPLGTLRGTPTTSAAHSRGAASLSINAPAGQTLLAGDMIGCGGQLFMVSQNCVSVAGVIVVPVVNRVRATIALGAAVTWSRPTAEFIVPGEVFSLRRPGYQEGMAIDLEEDF